jgi:hypothetical protein
LKEVDRFDFEANIESYKGVISDVEDLFTVFAEKRILNEKMLKMKYMRNKDLMKQDYQNQFEVSNKLMMIENGRRTEERV